MVQKAGLRYGDMAGFVADSRGGHREQGRRHLHVQRAHAAESGRVAVAHVQDPDHLPRVSGRAAAVRGRPLRGTVNLECRAGRRRTAVS